MTREQAALWLLVMYAAFTLGLIAGATTSLLGR